MATIKKQTLQKFLRQWESGDKSKEDIERELGFTTAKGKAITRLWESKLNVDTRYGQVVELV
jgi:hypothetical protein